MNEPKYKIGDTVWWNGCSRKIEAVRNYQNYCWVYDFEKHPTLPMHLTGIAEQHLRVKRDKHWWEFWK